MVGSCTRTFKSQITTFAFKGTFVCVNAFVIFSIYKIKKKKKKTKQKQIKERTIEQQKQNENPISINNVLIFRKI